MWREDESVSIERSGREEGSTGPGMLLCRKKVGKVRQQSLRRNGQPGR